MSEQSFENPYAPDFKKEDKDFSWNRLDDKWKGLADAHWSYVKSVLLNGPHQCPHSTREQEVDEIGWHYKGAALHFAKHALEEMPKTEKVYVYKTRPEYISPGYTLGQMCFITVCAMVIACLETAALL